MREELTKKYAEERDSPKMYMCVQGERRSKNHSWAAYAFYGRPVKVKVSSKFEKVIKLTPAFIISTYKDLSEAIAEDYFGQYGYLGQPSIFMNLLISAVSFAYNMLEMIEAGVES